MDRLIVERKLDSLQRCLARIAVKRPRDLQQLQADLDLQDVLVLNLSRAVQTCVDLAAHMVADLSLPPPDTMGETFERLNQSNIIDAALTQQMKKAVGFRNIAVHAYDAIDWNIVFAIATERLEDFERFAKVVAARLQAGEMGAKPPIGPDSGH